MSAHRGLISLLGHSSGGVTPTVPTGISNLWAWYKRNDFYSDLGSTKQTTNNGIVKQWNDSSGNGRHLFRNDANVPKLDTSTTHLGTNSIQFDPSGGTFHCFNFTSGGPGSPGTTAGEIFVTLKSRTDAPSIDRALCSWNASGSGITIPTVYPTTGGHIKDDFGDTSQHDWGAITTADAFHVMNIDTSSSARNFRFDSTLIGTLSSPSGHVLDGFQFFGTDANTSNPWDGWVFEMVIYTAVLSSGDRNALYAYLTT